MQNQVIVNHNRTSQNIKMQYQGQQQPQSTRVYQSVNHTDLLEQLKSFQYYLKTQMNNQVNSCITKLNQTHKFVSQSISKVQSIFHKTIDKIHQLTQKITQKDQRPKQHTKINPQDHNSNNKINYIQNNGHIDHIDQINNQKYFFDSESQQYYGKKQNGSNKISHNYQSYYNQQIEPQQNDQYKNHQSDDLYYMQMIQGAKVINQTKVHQNKTNHNKSEGNGPWTHQQNQNYYIFLEINYKYFVDQMARRSSRVIKYMSEFIGTRSAKQCRSHQQAIQKKYGNFQLSLLALRKQRFGKYDSGSVLHFLMEKGITAPDGVIDKYTLSKSGQAKLKMQNVKNRYKKI